MHFESIVPGKAISLFVKDVLIFEEEATDQKTVLPFFADGYPGLIFHETANGLLVNPHNKMMPPLFLYGQTIHPIELVMEGAYKLIAFQLYPFVLKSFFNLVPGQLTDNCYDLSQIKEGTPFVAGVQQAASTADRVEIISSMLQNLFRERQQQIDETIAVAIKNIISNKGRCSIRDIYEPLHLTERSFGRRFNKTVGISPKQFARIIQFQQSLQQLTLKDYNKLSDIVYENGFADQSHFIKVFKAFTGKTPLAFRAGK